MISLKQRTISHILMKLWLLAATILLEPLNEKQRFTYKQLFLDIEENLLIYCYLTCINIVSFTFLIETADTCTKCGSLATG